MAHLLQSVGPTIKHFSYRIVMWRVRFCSIYLPMQPTWGAGNFRCWPLVLTWFPLPHWYIFFLLSLSCYQTQNTSSWNRPILSYYIIHSQVCSRNKQPRSTFFFFWRTTPNHLILVLLVVVPFAACPRQKYYRDCLSIISSMMSQLLAVVLMVSDFKECLG